MDFNLTIPIIFKRKERQNCFPRKTKKKLFIPFKHFIRVFQLKFVITLILIYAQSFIRYSKGIEFLAQTLIF